MSDDQHLVRAEDNPFAHIEHSNKRAMPTAFRKTCNVRLSAEMAETSRTSHYRWLNEDSE